MRKSDFAAAARAQATGAAPKFEGSSDIQEIKVLGDWAFMWQKLTVIATPPDGAPMRREGHTLTIFNKQGGKWVLARDANMLK
jgi:ketosteroid isomerase-like protein